MIDYDLIGKSTPTDLLIEAGRRLGVASIVQTEQHPLFMALALKHATYMADVHKQGHQGFDKRAADIMRMFPGSTPSEIAAESWKGQSDVEAADDAYKSWKSSKGHWRECSAAHTYYGYAMVRGGNIWYSCGLFANV